eukprot:scaffold9489_cov89-Cylindrotheca_fusiformis.AAC.1
MIFKSIGLPEHELLCSTYGDNPPRDDMGRILGLVPTLHHPIPLLVRLGPYNPPDWSNDSVGARAAAAS